MEGNGLKHLVHLKMQDCMSLSDDGMQYLGYLERLTSLVLMGCEHLTDAGIIRLCGLPRLEELDLGYCGEIGDESLACFSTASFATTLLRYT